MNLISIVSFIGAVLNTTLIAVLLNDYVKRIHPRMYEEILVNVSYHLIYGISKAQIYSKNMYKQIHMFNKNILLKNPRLTELLDSMCPKIEDNTPNVEFVLDGKVIFEINSQYLFKEIVELDNFDFIIYSQTTNDIPSTTSTEYNRKTSTRFASSTFSSKNTVVNKKILTKLPVKQEELFCDQSNIKFILAEVFFGDKSLKIDFKPEADNYYIDSNVFDSAFMNYFLNKYYGDFMKDITPDKVNDYILKILDHNVTTVAVDNKSSIKIVKDGYEKLDLKLELEEQELELEQKLEPELEQKLEEQEKELEPDKESEKKQ